MSLLIIATGGTFDKEYNELSGEFTFKETHVRKMLEIGRNTISIRVKTIMLIDSLDMTDMDRRVIMDTCEREKENRIIVTHGTDTMVETAQFIGRKVQNKTIVITGAMVPYTFGSSDGMFNLGCSVGLVQILPAGVYVSMNGHYFTWDNVKKNKKTGKFEEVMPHES